jgi:hypothetical protein
MTLDLKHNLMVAKHSPRKPLNGRKGDTIL